MFKSWDEMTEEEQLLTTISDVHKDAYGFRPRSRYDGMTVEQLKAELEFLYEDMDRTFKMEQARQKENDNEFAESVARAMEVCNCSFTTAIRYMMDAEEDRYLDMDCFLWTFDLSPEYTAEVKQKLKLAGVMV